MSRKSRKKRERKLQRQIDRERAFERLGGHSTKRRRVTYQEGVPTDNTVEPPVVCPWCRYPVGDTHGDPCPASPVIAEERDRLVRARRKRAMRQTLPASIPEKPARLTTGPAAARKRVQKLIAMLNDENVSLAGVQEVRAMAEQLPHITKKDAERVETLARKRWKELHELWRQRGRLKRGRVAKHFGWQKKL